MAACLILGIILIVIPIAKGACDDGGSCRYTTSTTEFNKGDRNDELPTCAG